MPTATSEQLSGLLKEANDGLKTLYQCRSIEYKKDKKTGLTTMIVYKNKQKEYETVISSYSSPSLVNPQILIMSSFYKELDKCTIDIDSPLKEADVRFMDYCYGSGIHSWARSSVEEWIRVNFPVK